MTHWQRPPGVRGGPYSDDPAGAPGAIWLLTVPVAESVEVALFGGDGMVVESNNPGVIETNRQGKPEPERVVGSYRVFKITGMRPDTTLIEVRKGIAGPRWSKLLQVKVVPGKKGLADPDKAKITLDPKSMALNAAGTPFRYHMDVDITVGESDSAAMILDKVAVNGPLKHAIVSSHGYVDKETGNTTIACGLGMTFGNAGEFARIRDKVGVFWFGACVAAGSEDGVNACKKRAAEANCHVVAPGFALTPPAGSPRDLPKYQIDLNSRYMPKVFTPTGGMIPWPNFLLMGARFGFKLK